MGKTTEEKLKIAIDEREMCYKDRAKIYFQWTSAEEKLALALKHLNFIEKNQYEDGERLGIEGMQSLACNTLAELGYYD